MKISASRKALLVANGFNLCVAIYFIIIAIVALVQLRWYHQLTITVRVRHLITLATSYFAFFILLFVALLLIAIFVTSTLRLAPRRYVSPSLEEDALEEPSHHQDSTNSRSLALKQSATSSKRPGRQRRHLTNRIVLRDSILSSSSLTGANDNGEGNLSGGVALIAANRDLDSNSSVCCTIFVHLLTAACLVIILIIWLFNTGELVRDSISTQLDVAFARYQFTNRSNYYSIAIDGMQDVNNCCGSLDYTDFPHQRISGLSSGLYPGSCCGKNIFGVNARVLCTPEEIWRAKQTTGCTTVLANYYDLISLLVVPVALISLFVNITLIALITISKGTTMLLLNNHHRQQTAMAAAVVTSATGQQKEMPFGGDHRAGGISKKRNDEADPANQMAPPGGAAMVSPPAPSPTPAAIAGS